MRIRLPLIYWPLTLHQVPWGLRRGATHLVQKNPAARPELPTNRGRGVVMVALAQHFLHPWTPWILVPTPIFTMAEMESERSGHFIFPEPRCASV